MSTSPDELIAALSRWLAGHLDNVALTASLAAADRSSLTDVQAEAVDELLADLREAPAGRRGRLERVVRETLEALALG
jgi:hypothetical protein